VIKSGLFKWGLVRQTWFEAGQGAGLPQWMTKSCRFEWFETSPEIIRLAVMIYVRFPEGVSMRAVVRQCVPGDGGPR
jgi:hypothetical protein